MAKTALHYIINRPKGEISVPSAEFASRAESEGQFAIKGKREVIKVTSMHRVVKLRVHLLCITVFFITVISLQ